MVLAGPGPSGSGRYWEWFDYFFYSGLFRSLFYDVDGNHKQRKVGNVFVTKSIRVNIFIN